MSGACRTSFSGLRLSAGLLFVIWTSGKSATAAQVLTPTRRSRLFLDMS